MKTPLKTLLKTGWASRMPPPEGMKAETGNPDPKPGAWGEDVQPFGPATTHLLSVRIDQAESPDPSYSMADVTYS